MNTVTEKLLTPRECATLLGYKGATAYRRVIGLANRGMLPVIRLGSTLRFHWPSVLAAQFRSPVCTQPTSGGGEPRSILRPPERQTVRANSEAPDPTEGLSPLDLFPSSQQRTAARHPDRSQRAAVVKARRGPIPPRINSNPYL